MTENITLQKALYSIKKLKKLLQEKQPDSYQPIAIVGLSCRFPQALNKDEYWQLLCHGKNIISKIPEERWKLLSGTEEISLRDETHPYWGGYMANISAFDAYFFGISPREAVRMDPQQRLLLEVAYEAFEDAGLPVEKLAGSNMGVFASLYVSQLAHIQKIESDLDALYLPTGNVLNMAPNRISYLYDLRGPSLVIDTACSSSMVSLHLACLNLQNNLCDSALVCGARLNLLPYINFVLSKAKMLSPDGQCKTFDSSANGYALGEGVGAVVLKPLDKALKDNDRIYAVISGSAVNQDGKTNGLTAPNGLQQVALLNTAYNVAKVDPREVSYLECHGTGTLLGDPIEVQALGEVLSKQRSNEYPCWISSVKTNIGHLEHAAGIASIIKAALALKNAKIPPHLNLNNLNPHIAFEKFHFQVPKQIEPMPKYGSHRIAGVSGFGFGGTSAHIVMREVSEQESVVNSPIVSDHRQEIFTLSAKDPVALKKYVEIWCSFLKNNPSLNLSQLSYLMHLRRSHYSHRLAIIADTTSQLLHSLIKVQETNLEDLNNSENIFIGMNKKVKLEPAQLIAMESEPNESKKLALLYINSRVIDWVKYEEMRQYLHIDLPLYPFQYKNYWPSFENKQIANTNNQIDSYPMQGRRLVSPLNSIQFEFKIGTQYLPDLQETRYIFHVGYYLEILAYAIDNLFQQSEFAIEKMSFLSPLVVPNDSNVVVQLTLDKIDNDSFSFNFYSHSPNQKNWILHAKGNLLPKVPLKENNESIEKIKSRCGISGVGDKIYDKVHSIGIPVGNSLRWVQQYWLGKNEMLCRLQQPSLTESNGNFKLKIHPSIFDAAFHPLFMFVPEASARPYIASYIERLNYHGIKKPLLYWLGSIKDAQHINECLVSDYSLLADDNQVIAEFKGVRLLPLNSKINIEKITNFEAQSALDLSLLSPEQRRNKIINFLIERTADILSMPKEDINIDQSLSNLGIDSLMALILIKDIETGLGENFSVQTILEGATISSLAGLIIKDSNVSPGLIKPISNTENYNKWIAYRKHKPNATIRLFCFPYGGGGASTYLDWQQILPEHIEVCPIQLPGRESRVDEPCISQFNDLIEVLFKDLKMEFRQPYAFFGHSFGGLVAFELTRYLRKQASPLPSHLFVSAFHDPNSATRSLDNLLQQLKVVSSDFFNINTLNDAQVDHLCEILLKNKIIDFNSHKIKKEIIRNLLPNFIADMSMMKSYHYQAEQPLDLPISLFIGKQDTWITYEEHLGWVNYSKQKIKLHEFDGDHFFIKDNVIKKQILKIIVSEMIPSANIENLHF